MSKIFVASDHAGFALKNALTEHIRTLGYEVEDVGAYTLDPEDDYPDFVTPLAKKVAESPDARGIVVAGSGQGEAMCANRILGVRAAVFYGPMRVTAALDIEGGRSEDGYDAVRLPADTMTRTYSLSAPASSRETRRTRRCASFSRHPFRVHHAIAAALQNFKTTIPEGQHRSSYPGYESTLTACTIHQQKDSLPSKRVKREIPISLLRTRHGRKPSVLDFRLSRYSLRFLSSGFFQRLFSPLLIWREIKALMQGARLI